MDLAVVAYERMLANAENHILTATAAVDARVGWTRDRQRWAGMTQQQMLKAFADALLEIRIALTGKAK